MAEPNSPAEDATPGRRSGDDGPELLAPPTEEELAETGEPTLEEVRAAAAGDTEVIHPEPTEVLPAAETAAEPAPPATEQPTAAEPAAAESAPPPPPPPVAPAVQVPPQPVLAPAEDSAPPPPRVRGNRLVGTAWVLLASGVFEALFFGLNALVAFTFGGPAAAAPQVQSVAQTSLAWLPVLLFFLLFELTVLLLNRAGRVAYVFASLVVGVIVYVLSALLFSVIVRHTLGDSNTLAQAFLNWEFIVIGIAAREVMLWAGLAIGSRGIRLRRRNKEERARYDEELAAA